MPKDPQQPLPDSRFRRFLKNLFFSVITISVFLIAFEGVLALVGVRPVLLTEDPWVGFAENVPQFVEAQQADGSIWLVTAQNKRVLFNEQRFPKEKSEKAYRIFCMGGSTTYGRPYFDGVSFCGWLRAYLRAADSTRDWEVINAGGVSFASYRVAKLMDELKDYQPDLFIVYSGQNEFLEKRSYGGVMDLPPWMLQFDTALSATRTYTAMKNLIDALKPDSLKQARERSKLSGEVDEILNHTLGPVSYTRNDRLKAQVIKHYRFNLRRMVHIAREVDAGILFIQPAINLKDMSPFKSEHKAGLSDAALKDWQDRFDRAAALQEEGKLDAALSLYREALALDDRHADLHFRIGRVLFAMGRYGEAEAAFWRAVDEDIAPLRILSGMQEIVKDVADGAGVPLIDFPQILRETYLREYGHAVFGKEYFPDHVHANLEAYRLLGLALLEHLRAQGLVKPDPSWNAERMEAVNREVISGLDPKAEGYTLRNLGKVFDWAGKFEEANQAFLQALKILGPDPLIYERLANSAVGRGQLDEAVHYLAEVAALDPERGDVHRKMGALLAQQGETDEAIEHFLQELERFPDNVLVHAELAIQYGLRGEDARAIEHFETALAIAPEFEFAHLNFALFLANRGDDKAALAHSREVLRINPNQHLAHNTMGLIFKKQGRFEEAIPHFKEALRLQPGFEAAETHLRQLREARNAQADDRFPGHP